MVKAVSSVSYGVYLDLTAYQALASSGIDPNAIKIIRPESPVAPVAPHGAIARGRQVLASSDIGPSAVELVQPKSPMAPKVPCATAVRFEDWAHASSDMGLGAVKLPKSSKPPMPPYGAAVREALASSDIESDEGQPIQPATPMAHKAPFSATVQSAFPSFTKNNKKRR